MQYLKCIGVPNGLNARNGFGGRGMGGRTGRKVYGGLLLEFFTRFLKRKPCFGPFLFDDDKTDRYGKKY